MYEVLAEAAGQEAARVLHKMAGVEAGTPAVCPCDPELSLEELLLRVTFQADYGDYGFQDGAMLLGGPAAQLGRLAVKIAGLLGLKSSRPPEADQLLGEMLNVIAGHTASRWQDYGYRVNFAPPDILTGQGPGPLTKNTFEVNLNLAEFPGLRLWLVFPEREFQKTVGC